MRIRITPADYRNPNAVRGDSTACPTVFAVNRLQIKRNGQPATRVTLGDAKRNLGGRIWFGDLVDRNSVELPPSASQAEREWDQGVDASFGFIINGPGLTRGNS